MIGKLKGLRKKKIILSKLYAMGKYIRRTCTTIIVSVFAEIELNIFPWRGQTSKSSPLVIMKNYISLRGSCGINIAFYDVNADDWEKVPDNPTDWDYIIKNKCLCWFWDDDTDGVMAILVSVYKDSPYCYYCRDLAGCGSSRKHCRPIRKDEVNFYEDKDSD